MRGFSQPTDRVRKAQYHAYRALEALATAPGEGKARLGMGRSPHADDFGAQEARLHSRGHPRLHGPDRIAKTDSMVDIQLLEHCLREDLNRRARRYMAVLRPLRLVIENWPEDRVEEMEAVNNPRILRPEVEKFRFPGSSTSNAMISRKILLPSISGFSRGIRSVFVTGI